MTPGSTQPPADGRTLASDVLVAVALALVVFAVSRAYALPLVGLHHDDGQYVVAAKALATGQGYRQVHVPGAPPQAKFPVLFPLMLAALWRSAAPLSSMAWLMSAACSAALAVAGALVFLAARRRFGLPAWAALPIIAAGFTLPALAGLCAQVMSEAPFLLLLAAGLALLAGERTCGGQWWAAGVAFGCAALTRSIGVSVVAGLAAWLAWRRDWRVGLLAPSFGLPAAWFAWARAAQAGGALPAGYGTSYEGWLRSVPVDAWSIVVRDNLLAVFVHTGHLVSQPAIGVLPAGARPVAALLVGAALVIIFVLAAREVGGAWAWALGGYLAAAILWPWPPSRFLVVVLPLALVLAAAAVRERRHWLRTASAVAVLLCAANIVHAAGAARAGRDADGLVLPGSRPAAWREYTALFDWLRTRTPPDAIVASVAEPMVYLYADRAGVFPFEQRTIAINYSNPPSIGDDEDLDALLEHGRVTHLVRLPAPAWAHTDMLDEVIEALRAREPRRLRSVYRGADARFEVFEVTRGRGPRE